MEKYWALCSWAEDWNVADDIEDCINQARDFDPNINFIYVGDLERAEFSVDGIELIEMLQEQACSQYGDDAGEWLDDIPDTKELTDGINEVLQEWLDKNNLQPTFGNIVNIEKVEV